jgi:hypothetical protein
MKLDTQRVKDTLSTFKKSVESLRDLYNDFPELNDIQPDADGVYARCLFEWVDEIHGFNDEFSNALDNHEKECPLTYDILKDQLGKKVDDWDLETHSDIGCIGIRKGDVSVIATPDWDGTDWTKGELSVEIYDDGEQVSVTTLPFDYSLTVNGMVNNWKKEVINAGLVFLAYGCG